MDKFWWKENLKDYPLNPKNEWIVGSPTNILSYFGRVQGEMFDGCEYGETISFNLWNRFDKSNYPEDSESYLSLPKEKVIEFLEPLELGVDIAEHFKTQIPMPGDIVWVWGWKGGDGIDTAKIIIDKNSRIGLVERNKKTAQLMCMFYGVEPTNGEI